MDNESASQVRLLATLHWVIAGVGALFLLLPVGYIAVGGALLRGALGRNAARPPPPQIGWIFVAIGAVMLAMGIAYIVLVALGGWFLSRRRYWTFCLVTAAISCAFFPFGTALGIFTVVVLARPGVKEAFDGAAPSR